MADFSHVDSNIITTATDSTGATVISLVQSNVTESSTVDSVVVTGGKGAPGTNGQDGQNGVDGVSPTVSVGTTTTGSAGTDATVTNSGTDTDVTLDFTIPQGVTGDTGPSGPANSLSIGTVSTGATAATITGTAPNQTLNLTLQKGDTGGTGSTGKGFTGGNYSATTGEVTFTSNDSLGFSTGDLRGKDGTNGSDGAAATISAGTTSTLAPGSSATVANSGTSSAATFDFGIPSGSVWYSGAGTPSTTHNDGDYYLNTSNGDVYKQASGSWGSSIENLTGPTGSAGSASGSDTQVQFNDGGTFAGDSGMTYNKTSNVLTVAGGVAADLTGNADTATKLETARNIGGVSFDGSADIDLAGVNTSGTQDTTGNAATATKLATARTIAGNSFDGSANITIAGTDLSATGTPSSSKYLRGDNTWNTPTNTTYSAMSVSEGEAGTATTSRVVRADYLEQIINYYVDQALSTMNADNLYGWQ